MFHDDDDNRDYEVTRLGFDWYQGTRYRAVFFKEKGADSGSEEAWMPRFEWEDTYLKEVQVAAGGVDGDPLSGRQVCMPGSYWGAEDESVQFIGKIGKRGKFKKRGKLIEGYYVRFDDGDHKLATDDFLPYLVA